MEVMETGEVAHVSLSVAEKSWADQVYLGVEKWL